MRSKKIRIVIYVYHVLAAPCRLPQEVATEHVPSVSFTVS